MHFQTPGSSGLVVFFLLLGDDLMRCVDLYNQSQSKWFEEMVTTSLVRKHASYVCAKKILLYFTICIFIMRKTNDETAFMECVNV